MLRCEELDLKYSTSWTRGKLTELIKNSPAYQQRLSSTEATESPPDCDEKEDEEYDIEVDGEDDAPTEAQSETYQKTVDDIDFKSARDIWRYLISRESRQATEEAIDAVKTKLNSKSFSHYADHTLKNHIPLFAYYARVWDITFGLVATSLQENLNWTIKSPLRGKSVMAHKFLAFFERYVRRRNIRIHRKQKVGVSLANLERDVQNAGYVKLLEAVKGQICDDARLLVLQSFEWSSRYSVVRPIRTLDALECSLPKFEVGSEEISLSVKRFQALISALDKAGTQYTLYQVRIPAKAWQHCMHVWKGPEFCLVLSPCVRVVPTRTCCHQFLFALS